MKLVAWKLRLLVALLLLPLFAGAEESTPTLEQLRSMQAQLEAQYQALQAEGISGEAVLSRVRKALANPSITSQQKAELQAYVAAADAKLGKFQDAYDQFLMSKLNYLGERYLAIAEEVVKQAAPTMKPEQATQIRKNLEEMRANYAHYQNGLKKPLDRDLARFYNYRKVIGSFRELVTQAEDANTGLGRKLRRRFEAMSENAGFLTFVPELIVSLYKLVRNESSLTGTMRTAFARFARMNGYDVKIEGRENLKPPPGSDALSIYTMNHANGILDNVVFTKLGIKRSRIVADLDSAFPPWLQKYAVQHPDLLTVGGPQRDPVKIVLADRAAGTHDSFAIFPEGNVPSGIDWSVRPVARTFEKLFLGRLNASGTDLRLVPITSPGHYRLFADLAAPQERDVTKSITSKVHEAIDPAMMRFLLSKENDGALGHLLRQLQIDENHKFGLANDRALGMPSIDDNVRLADSYLLRKIGCRGGWSGLLAKGGNK